MGPLPPPPPPPTISPFFSIHPQDLSIPPPPGGPHVPWLRSTGLNRGGGGRSGACDISYRMLEHIEPSNFKCH